MEQPPIPNTEETIFPKTDFSMEGYDKHSRNARIMLFVLAGLFLLGLVNLTPFDEVLSFLLQPASIFQGWFLKIIVILLLILGLRNAKESQRLMEAYGKKASPRLSIVFQYGPQPSLDFGERHAFARSILGNLISFDLTNTKIFALRICEIPTTHR
jgi:hypothetical protein